VPTPADCLSVFNPEAAILKFCLHEEGWAMWGPGSSGPVAIRVGYAPGTGRGVFAVRDIAVGDLTHTADPVVAHLALASLQKVGSTSSP
jgi:hypothetical protein